MHLPVSGDGFREVEVDILALSVAGEDAHGQLLSCGPVLAVRDEVHECVEKREAWILQREAEVALCIIHPDGAKAILYFKSYCE